MQHKAVQEAGVRWGDLDQCGFRASAGRTRSPPSLGTTVNGSAFVGIRGTSFGQRAQDIFHYRFNRWTRWIDNTPASPADIDADSQSSGQADVCPAVPRTVVNEGSCVRRVSSSCGG